MHLVPLWIYCMLLLWIPLKPAPHMYMHTQHLRSLEIYSGDSVGEERSKNKREYKFYVQRADGRYVFKVRSCLSKIMCWTFIGFLWIIKHVCAYGSYSSVYTYIYSTSQKSLNKRPTSGHILRLCLPTHWTQFPLRLSSNVRLHLRSPVCVCVRICVHSRSPPVSAYVHICMCASVSACICVRLRLRSSACSCKGVSFINF